MGGHPTYFMWSTISHGLYRNLAPIFGVKNYLKNCFRRYSGSSLWGTEASIRIGKAKSKGS